MKAVALSKARIHGENQYLIRYQGPMKTDLCPSTSDLVLTVNIRSQSRQQLFTIKSQERIASLVDKLESNLRKSYFSRIMSLIMKLENYHLTKFVSLFLQSLFLDINFNQMPERPPLQIKPSYQGAASEFQHLYEYNEETVKKV